MTTHTHTYTHTHTHKDANRVFSPQSLHSFTVSQTDSQALSSNICQLVILHAIKQNRNSSHFKCVLHYVLMCEKHM